MRYKLNNEYLVGQFTVKDVAYPWNWLELATADELTTLGITMEPDLLPDVPTLDELKAAKRREINRARDTTETAGFSYLNHTFDSDARSVSRIGIAAQAAAQEPAFQIGWTDANNAIVMLDQAAMVAMPMALANNAYMIHSKAYGLKAQLDLAQTAEQVAAITWS